MEIKSTLHIPVEQYGFVEVEITKGTYDDKVDDEIFKMYCEIKEIFANPEKVVDGLSNREFIKMMDSISIGNPAFIGDYESLNEDQNAILQAIKRAYNRSPMAKAKVEKREETK